MRFLDRHPQLKPYIGSQYHAFSGPRIYFIGESHYLPKESEIHTQCETWYNSSVDDLNEKEYDWTFTAGVLFDFKGKPTHKPYQIFLNILKVFDQVITGFDDVARASEYIAFSNFFIRPAYTGSSLHVKKKDIEMANEAFQQNIELIKPDAAVFTSSLAFNNLDKSNLGSIKLLRTPHPSSQWWNRIAKTYGGKKGYQMLEDFLVNLKSD